MTSNIESTAVLMTRAEFVGVDVAGRTAMMNSGFDTMAKFAYMSSYMPGQQDDQAFRADLAAMLGAAPAPGQLASYRRLFAECHTLCIADLRDRVSRTEDSAPRKLAAPERAARHAAMSLRLPNLVLQGELEISHSLLDKVLQMAEDGALIYISIDMCTRRDQEVVGLKVDKAIMAGAGGVLKLSQEKEEPSADLATDFKVRNAFQRRSLAFDMAGLIGYELMESWHVTLFTHLMRVPPPGYRAVDLNQAIAADRELFRRMAEDTRAGITSSAGVRPLETSLRARVTDNSVTHLLQPLQEASSSARSQQHQVHQAQGSPVIKQSKKAKAKAKAAAKGKGKGKKEGSAARLTDYAKDFVGMNLKDEAGVNICFNFNKACGCAHAQAGGRCGRGRHICMMKGCGKPHGAHEHSKFMEHQ